MNPPNILYIHSHDTGRFVQPYGHAVHTPRIQQLAEQGVLFRQAFCANPTCSPSRACLLTGQYAHANGMLGLAHRGFRLDNYERHIVHTLRQAGYTSALSGIQHVAAGKDGWRTIGYDTCLGSPKDAEVKARDWILGTHDKPFFLSVGFQETHREFQEPHPEDSPAYCAPAPLLPDTTETRLDMARFKSSARVLDHKIGVVLDALADAGLAENTLVICTTDHGIAFPRMKCNLTDGGIGVMLMLRGPGSAFSGGKVHDSLVSQVDLFPTICDWLGIERPAWLQGVSLMPMLRGEVSKVRDEIFAEVNFHAAYEPQRCVRTERFKYIRRYDERTRPVLPNCDDSPSKDTWMRHGWAERPPDPEALYDLVFDPSENSNLAAHPDYRDVLADLRTHLSRWMQETDDPLLHGPVPRPKESRVNNPDGISPRETDFI